VLRQKPGVSNVSHLSQYFRKALALLSASPLGDLSLDHFLQGHYFFVFDRALKE